MPGCGRLNNIGVSAENPEYKKYLTKLYYMYELEEKPEEMKQEELEEKLEEEMNAETMDF